MRQHRLRVDEVVGLSIVTLAVVEICLRWFGLRDPLSLVIVAVGCASYSAERLLQVRRFGSAAARSADVCAAMAVAPVMVLPLAHAMAPTAALWQPSMPTTVKYVGMALAIGVALSRCVRPSADRPNAHRRSAAVSSWPSLLLMTSVLLITFSKAAALVTAYWLVAIVLQRPKPSAAALPA